MPTDEEIQDCWDRSLRAFGTAHIFERRSRGAKRRIRVLSFVGMAVPVLIGGLVASFLGMPALQPYLGVLIAIGGVLATVQLVFSIWSLLAKWEDTTSYGSESSIDNLEISDIFKGLAQKPPADFAINYEVAKERDRARSTQDLKIGVTDNEKRMGMRAALRQFQKKCVACGEVPRDMKPTTCPVCGNFGFRMTRKKVKEISPGGGLKTYE